MRSFPTLLVVATSVALVAHNANAQQNYYGSPSLLPNPAITHNYSQSGPTLHYVAQSAGQQATPQYNAVPAATYTAEPVAEQTTAQPGCACGTGVSDGYAVGASTGYAGDIGYSLYGNHGGGCGWFASASGLIMGYDADDHTRFSYDNVLGGQYSIMDSKDASMDFSGGVELRVGKYFNCGQNAIEFIYWGIYPTSQSSVITAGAPNTVRSYVDYQWVSNPSATQTGDYYTVNSSAQRLRRDWEFHNVELNLMSFSYSCGLGSCCGTACGGCNTCDTCTTGCSTLGHGCGMLRPRGFMATVGVGLRYFRFDDELAFSAATSGNPAPYFYEDTTQLDHTIDLDNNLFGIQLNGAIDYQLSCRLKARAATKFGVYGNHVSQRQTITNSNGYFTVNGGRDYDYRSSKDDIAFIGELDLGLNYQINCHWNASIGYRAVVAAGVALAPNQMPQDVRDVADVQYIETNNSLLLHGGYAGLEFNY